jgi:hypothetical protein
MPMLTGLEHATKVVFDELPNDEWIEELSGAVIDHFRTRIEGIQQEWIDNGKKWKDDRGWKLVVREEEQKLKRKMRPDDIKRSRALGRVNGGLIDGGATILRLPLTMADLA